MVHPQANWLKEHNGRHQLHPMTPQAAVAAHPPVIIASGDGVHVTDVDGRRFLDCQGGLWCVNAGHGRQEIKDAIIAQLDTLQYYTLFPGSANAPSIQLSAKLCEIAAEERIAKVFFSSGGSDTVEAALKISRQYWKIMGEPERYKFISLRNGYHGVHFGGLSASGGNFWKRSYEPLMGGFFQVESPYLYRNPFTEDPEELAAICATLLEREIEHQSPDTVAAIIAEPVQGAGGVIVPPTSYWPRLREICDRHGILLIADEIVTGLGRSGCLFGSRGWGVKPDIITLAKGLTSGYVPLGATLINDRVAQAFDRDSPHAVFAHGLTYSGHPVACAAGLASVELVLKEDFPANAAAVGAYFLERLRTTLSRHAPIGDIRGKGLMIAIEMVKDRRTKEPFSPVDPFPIAISEYCVANGVMVRCIAHKIIISPPLVFTRDHVDLAVDVLDQAFSLHTP
jgi:adenosylmethionine-8-amino-7-oxononanoate aminotransferase